MPHRIQTQNFSCTVAGRFAAIVAWVLLVAGCAGTPRTGVQVEPGDYSTLAVAAFAQIDRRGEITTIVLADDADPLVRKALRRVHKVVSPTQVPTSPDLILPAGYFLVHGFHVDDEGAVIEGQLGPVTHKLTAANLPDCGKLYSISFFATAEGWYNPSYKVSTCEQKRIWWPVDEAEPAQAAQVKQPR